MLSRWRFPGADIVFTLILFGMFIPYQAVMIPLREIVTTIGIPPGIPDLLEGRLQVGFLPGPLSIQHVQSGKLRALAVLADKRLATLPDVPTFAEADFADANVVSWYVIAVRAGTPAPIVERIHASALKALREPDTRDRLTKAGCEVPSPRSPAEVMAMWKTDFERYGKLVKEAGIKGET